jgi:asparagine synthase (glutamine-hydrolysing)
MLAIFSEEEKQSVVTPAIFTDFHSVNKQIQQDYFTRHQPLLSQLLRFENKVLLSENLLMKVDKNTMAHGIEARVPFLDHRVVEFAAGLHDKQKLNGFTDKYLLRKTMKPYLPRHTAMQKKERFFVPIDVWLRNDLQPIIEQLLHKSLIRQQGFFNYHYIQKAQERYARSPLYYGRQLWTLLHFQIWYRLFIEKENVIV